MYDTPSHVAQQLLRHAPKNMSRLLEPAVGRGALLRPILNRLERDKTNVTCVDTDSEALQEMGQNLRVRGISSECVNEDFLTWSTKQQPQSFDCVLMNPPFAGSRTNGRYIDLSKLDIHAERVTLRIPLEAAFVYCAHRLLSTYGRLLTVLPCSVIMAQCLQPLRSFLLRTGSIEYVYEFPPRTFKTVDSRIFLLVFKKGASRRRITLVNPQSNGTQRLYLSLKENVPSRLDFNFHSSQKQLQILMRSTTFNWTPIGETAMIFRGTVPSVPRPIGVLHSTDFRQGQWKPPSRQSTLRTGRGKICLGDLLIRRVGRNNHLTLGDSRLVVGRLATDCLFVIRPQSNIDPIKLYFAFKLLFGLGWSPKLLERGTGAHYFCKSSLEKLFVPLNACDFFVDSYLSFRRAHLAGCIDELDRAIASVPLSLAPNKRDAVSIQDNSHSKDLHLEKHIRKESVPTPELSFSSHNVCEIGKYNGSRSACSDIARNQLDE